jgi:hypothetical protein
MFEIGITMPVGNIVTPFNRHTSFDVLHLTYFNRRTSFDVQGN